MTKILDGGRVTNITYSDGLMECQNHEGEKILIRGCFGYYNIEPVQGSYVVHGKFSGVIDGEDGEIEIIIHFQNDSGTIEIVKPKVSQPDFTLLRYNPVFLVLKTKNGKEEFVVRDIYSPWIPELGLFGGYLKCSLTLFVVI